MRKYKTYKIIDDIIVPYFGFSPMTGQKRVEWWLKKKYYLDWTNFIKNRRAIRIWIRRRRFFFVCLYYMLKILENEKIKQFHSNYNLLCNFWKTILNEKFLKKYFFNFKDIDIYHYKEIFLSYFWFFFYHFKIYWIYLLLLKNILYFIPTRLNLIKMEITKEKILFFNACSFNYIIKKEIMSPLKFIFKVELKYFFLFNWVIECFRKIKYNEHILPMVGRYKTRYLYMLLNGFTFKYNNKYKECNYIYIILHCNFVQSLLDKTIRCFFINKNYKNTVKLNVNFLIFINVLKYKESIFFLDNNIISKFSYLYIDLVQWHAIIKIYFTLFKFLWYSEFKRYYGVILEIEDFLFRLYGIDRDFIKIMSYVNIADELFWIKRINCSLDQYYVTSELYNYKFFNKVIMRRSLFFAILSFCLIFEFNNLYFNIVLLLMASTNVRRNKIKWWYVKAYRHYIVHYMSKVMYCFKFNISLLGYMQVLKFFNWSIFSKKNNYVSIIDSLYDLDSYFNFSAVGFLYHHFYAPKIRANWFFSFKYNMLVSILNHFAYWTKWFYLYYFLKLNLWRKFKEFYHFVNFIVVDDLRAIVHGFYYIKNFEYSKLKSKRCKRS